MVALFHDKSSVILNMKDAGSGITMLRSGHTNLINYVDIAPLLHYCALVW